MARTRSSRPSPGYARRPAPAPRGTPPTQTEQWLGWGLYGVLVVVGLGFGVWSGAKGSKPAEANRADAGPPKGGEGTGTGTGTPGSGVQPPKGPEGTQPPKKDPATTDPAKNPPAGMTPDTPPDAPPDVPPKKGPGATETPPDSDPPPAKKVPPVVKIDPPPTDPPATTAGAITFEKDINKIFKAKCNSCHGDPGIKPGGTLDLRTLTAIRAGGDSGAGAIPGKPNDSPIWQRIEDGTMPPPKKDKLTPAEIKAIKDWIAAGAK